MQQVWFNKLPKAEQERRKELVKSSKFILDILDEILYNKSIEVGNTEFDPSQYQSPSWAYMQADRNGYQRALRDVRKILDIKGI